MSDSISRKKSQRWASASKTSYDGGDWESYSSDSDEEITIAKLPALPKLNISPNSNPIGNSEMTNSKESTMLPPRKFPSQNMSIKSSGKSVNDGLDSIMHEISTEISCEYTTQGFDNDSHKVEGSIGGHDEDEDDDDEDDEEDDDDDDDDLMVSKTGYFASYLSESNDMNLCDEREEKAVANLKSKSDVESIPTISELPIDSNSEPKSHDHSTKLAASSELSSAEYDSILTDKKLNKLSLNDSKDNNSHIVEESNNDFNEICNSDKAEMHFREYSSNEENISEIDEAIESQSSKEKVQNASTEQLTIITDGNDPKEPEVLTSEEPGNDGEGDSHFSDTNSLLNRYRSGNSSNPTDNEADHLVIRKTSKTDLTYQDDYSSDVSYEASPIQPSDIRLPDERSIKSADSFKFNNAVRHSVLDTSDEVSDSSNDEEFEVSNKGYFSTMIEDENNNQISGQSLSSNDFRTLSDSDSDRKNVSSGETYNIVQNYDSDSIANSLEKTLSGVSFTKTIASENSDDRNDSTTDDEPLDENPNASPFDQVSSRESINLGKWRPEIENFRSGFVNESLDNVPTPEGYKVNDEGEIVVVKNSTNSSDNSDVMSTGSENSWNAFPQDTTGNDDDLHTIADTRTIYDNQTIYNIPAILANNASAPALPTHALSSEGEILTINDGTSGQVKPLAFDSTSSKIDATPIIKKPAIPSLDINNLLASLESHSVKIQKLNDYKELLKGYDSGLETWIQYTLKSSDIPDKDFIFKDYKVNKHVRDAYAHADALSKKNSVANTVNQNVSHLKKKMFSSSMREKSKGLFSSIGKKL